MNKHLKLSIGQYSSAGCKPINQDFHGFASPSVHQANMKGVAIALADGISSSDVSQIASETAIKSFLDDYYCTPEAWSVKASTHRVLKSINSWLVAQTQNSPYRYNKDRGYVCTFSGIIFKSSTAHIFHCGDSRVFRLAQNSLEQLTTDHRRIVDSHTSYLTHALGIQETLDLDYLSASVAQGDVFILATDGVYEFLTSRDIAQIVNRSIEAYDTRIINNDRKETENVVTEALNDTAKHIIEAAFAAGSNDNLSIQIVRIISLPESQTHELHQQATMLPAAPTLSPRKEFDGYLILREIYISSRSHVYLAKDLETGKQVVLKTPSTELRDDKAYLEQFLMEDWIAKRLNSAHIMKAYQASREQHYLYTVSEFIEGKTLAQWMNDTPKPSLEKVRLTVAQIAKGLQAFHRQEMIHQDLRPNNIMVDEQGVAKIIDFGATSVAGIDEIKGAKNTILGTAQFTAPEYFLGLGGTAQSDIFSLGVITYKMLSGKLPYGNQVSRIRTQRDLSKLKYKSLRDENQAIPAWVDEAIKTATHPIPHKRYLEISEFVYDLSKPSTKYLSKAKPPLIEREPVKFWQGLSLILACIVIYQFSLNF
jgi:serine/threonine protein phosphatase PrpC